MSRCFKQDNRDNDARVLLLGHSEGGLIALMLSSERDDIVGIILAVAPGALLSDILEYQMRAEAVISQAPVTANLKVLR